MNKNTLETAYNYLKNICDIAVDYDGFNTVESLKGLIDEMVSYVKEAMRVLVNTKSVQ